MRSSWVLVFIVAVSFVITACTDGAADTPTTSSPGPTTTTAPKTTVASPTPTEPPSTTTTTSVPPPEPPARGGTVIVGSEQGPPTLNPYVPGGDNLIVWEIAQAVHAGAFDVDPVTYEAQPDVLTTMPTVDNGGLALEDDGTVTVTFSIRDEAVWADGVPITGGDFAFTYETIMAGPDTDTRPYEAIVPESVAAGDKTFTFTITDTTPGHFENMFPILIPEHVVSGTDFLQDWNTSTWLASGPFELEEWVQGERIVLVRNDRYWRTDPEFGTQLPYLDEVIIEVIPDFDALHSAYNNGTIDITEVFPDTRVEPPGPETAVLQRVDTPIWEHFAFQFGEHNVNDDSFNRHVEFRRAVAHAIDREALAALGWWNSSDSPVDSYADAYVPIDSGAGWGRYEHDPEEARRLIGELCARLLRDCVENPPTIEFLVTREPRIEIAENLVPMLAEAGIELEVQNLGSILLFGESPLVGGYWDMTTWAWVGGPGLDTLLEVHQIFDPARPPPIGDNYYRWGTPAVTDSPRESHIQGPSTVMDLHTARYSEIISQMEATIDGDELRALAAEAEEILIDQVVFIPILRRGYTLAVRHGIEGVVANPTEGGLLWNVALWHRSEGL